MPDQINPDERARLLQEELDRRFAALEREVNLRLTAAKTIRRYLNDELNRRFEDIRREVDQRFDSTIHMRVALQEEMDRRFTDLSSQLDRRFLDSERAVQAALAAAEKAVIKAETASERRFDSVNEFRQTLTDQTSTFIPRKESEAQLKNLADRVTVNADRLGAMELRLSTRLERGEGAEAGTSAGSARQRLVVSQLIAGVALLVAIVSVILLALKK